MTDTFELGALTHPDHGTIPAVMRWLYPVDEPPVIEARGERLYSDVWRSRGWVWGPRPDDMVIDRVRTDARDIDGGVEAPGMFDDDAPPIPELPEVDPAIIALYTQPDVPRAPLTPPMPFDIRELTGEA